MLSSLTFISLVILTIPTRNVHSTNANDDLCKPRVAAVTKCYFSLYVNMQCKSAVFRFTETSFTKSCDSPTIFWGYPMNNLTLIIDTSYTAKRQAYALRLDAKQIFPSSFRVYQVQKTNCDTPLAENNGIMTAKSGPDFQVALKFQGPKQLSLFGVFIKYSVVRV